MVFGLQLVIDWLLSGECTIFPFHLMHFLLKNTDTHELFFLSPQIKCNISGRTQIVICHANYLYSRVEKWFSHLSYKLKRLCFDDSLLNLSASKLIVTNLTHLALLKRNKNSGNMAAFNILLLCSQEMWCRAQTDLRTPKHSGEQLNLRFWQWQK